MNPRSEKLRDWRHNDRPGRPWADPLFASRDVGSRIATKVRVSAGAFAGQRGTVARVDHPGSIAVRLDSGAVIPFARCELQRQEA